MSVDTSVLLLELFACTLTGETFRSKGRRPSGTSPFRLLFFDLDAYSARISARDKLQHYKLLCLTAQSAIAQGNSQGAQFDPLASLREDLFAVILSSPSEGFDCPSGENWMQLCRRKADTFAKEWYTSTQTGERAQKALCVLFHLVDQLDKSFWLTNIMVLGHKFGQMVYPWLRPLGVR
ncbi:hypothetical protein M408DRAFT_332917 [Serendipita vermifera MAFF 305830]|uniref:Uncharacterized protein n=1 Tax=Serendipita vermifera MAFF 305830 TaxID=933852 RepID=A0A0C3ACV8_SERVB|nr:hypothetical protein M408DRAFT_332917 [Serendipita vermifera MAFF 305830]